MLFSVNEFFSHKLLPIHEKLKLCVDFVHICVFPPLSFRYKNTRKAMVYNTLRKRFLNFE